MFMSGKALLVLQDCMNLLELDPLLKVKSWMLKLRRS